MIAFLQPLPIGNAVRVLLTPLDGAESCRVLRKLTDDIAGPDDSAAAKVYEGDERFFIDIATLENGATYYYCAFDLVDGDWVASGASQGVLVDAAAALYGPDPLTLVKQRLEAGLKVEVQAGVLVHDAGYIPVLTSPPAVEGVRWPVVTVHLRNDAPATRAVGELIADDVFDPAENEWAEAEGWLSGWDIEIWGWALNADLRIALRLAIKKVILGNLAVFQQAGMAQIAMSQSDHEDFERYNANVYQTLTSFSCMAPSLVQSRVGAVEDVDVMVQAA